MPSKRMYKMSKLRSKIFVVVFYKDLLQIIKQIHLYNSTASTQGSLLKFTAHQFRKLLLERKPSSKCILSTA